MSEESRPAGPYSLIQRIGALLLMALYSNWATILGKLRRILQSAICGHTAEGLYGILDYDLTLDLRDKQGRLAVFHRRQRVRFLQDHVIAFQDEAWGDGEVVATYRCSPGHPVDVFKIGSRHMILISLRQTKNRGDDLEFKIDRTVKNGFTKKEEWLEVETRYPTRRLRITILFPRGRPCQVAWLIARRADRTEALSARHFSWTSAGRQSLTWATNHPACGETYTVCWRW